VQNSTWDTPLFVASRGGHEAVVRLLIENGADISVQDFSGDTPLLAERWYPNIARILIGLGADVNSKHQNGRTLFSFAIMKDHHDLIQLLGDRGADESS
jgi:ankyrin repeat protein